MFRLHLIPPGTRIAFVKWWHFAFALSVLMAIGTVVLYFTWGLNYGVDFLGGTLFEVETTQAADIAKIRSTLGDLGFDDVTIQEFGSPNNVLIRVGGDAEATDTESIVPKVREALTKNIDPNIQFRRAEFVGPQVSGDLKRQGFMAVGFAIVAVVIYIWFRFEWQFSIGALAALLHDVILTVGFFEVTRLEFDLSVIAAILTIVGYSLNDTVVIFDRIRENLRRYKRMEMHDLIDLSLNETLSRTVVTAMTVLLALIALVTLGGPVIRGFSAAMIWGVVIGTYSSIYIASPIVLLLDLRRNQTAQTEEAPEKGAKDVSARKA
jgi:preprotein translocase SecF subunit